MIYYIILLAVVVALVSVVLEEYGYNKSALVTAVLGMMGVGALFALNALAVL